MSEPSANEYRIMLARVEAELANELKRSPSERDGALVEECLETLVFIRGRIDRLECRGEATTLENKARAALKEQSTGSGRLAAGRAGRRIRRVLIIAAIIAAVLACGIAVAEALGFRMGDVLFKLFSDRLEINESTAVVDSLTDASEDKSQHTFLATASLDGSVIVCESEEELCALFGSRLLYPKDTAGFVLKYAEVTAIGDGGEVNMCFVKTEDDTDRYLFICQEYYNESYGSQNHASALHLFDSFESVAAEECGGHEYALAAGGSLGAASFQVDELSCTIYGSANAEELDAIVISMLNGIDGMNNKKAAEQTYKACPAADNGKDHLRFSRLFSL